MVEITKTKIVGLLMDSTFNGKRQINLESEMDLNKFITDNKLEHSVDENVMIFPLTGNRIKLIAC